jgi:hypothetical protein
MKASKRMNPLVPAMLCALLLGSLACSSGDGSELRDAPIESAEVVSIDTFPPQYELLLVSRIPGRSCHRPQEPSVERDGTTFHVKVQNLFTGAEVCTADLGYREWTVPLEGDFEAGREYSVRVNDEPQLTFVAE